MDKLGLSLGCLLAFTLGCDSGEKEPDLGIRKTKSLSELKQAEKSDMSKEELEAARRQAGFKSPEEQRAEALAVYVAREKGYIKGRLGEFRAFMKDLRAELDQLEAAAAKWAKAKKPEAAFEKWQEKYKERSKALLDRYDELTEEGARGGDTKAELDKAVREWESLNAELNPEIAKEEGFPAVLKAIREQLDKVGEEFSAIEKDATIEAETPEPAGG